MARVAWLVARPLAGSGGQATVYARARALERAGHRCTFHLPPSAAGELGAFAAALAHEHGIDADRVRAGMADAAYCQAVIATDWGGLAGVALGPDVRPMQFLQDQEAGFRPLGDATLALEAAPCSGAATIALGRWLAASFADRYGRRPFLCDFGVDTAIYRPDDAGPRDDAVAFVLQPDKLRRCPETGLAALALVKRRRPQTEIRLFGHDEPPTPPFPAEHLGRLAPSALADLYRRCRVGLCLSASNPSRIPFEMMASGLPVVELYRANTLLDLPEAGALLAFQTPRSLATAIVHLLERQDRAAALGAAGAGVMSGRSGVEDRQFVAAFEAALAGAAPPASGAPGVYRRPPVIAARESGPATAAFLARQRAEAERLAAAA
ncbi:MAG: hypothetical protein AB7P02_20105 [Alphaproteobacteria bacterium]